MAARSDSPTAALAPSALDGETRVQIPIQEAAALLGISVWLAYRLAKSEGSDRLPTNRMGRNLYVPTEALRRYAQGHAPGGEAA